MEERLNSSASLIQRQKVGEMASLFLKRKFFNNKHLNARGGLEPLFRVLFSAVFQVFPWGISIRVENRGFWWKENCC
jgi:hypothetical protein